MTPSPGTIFRRSAAMAARRAMTSTSGAGMRMAAFLRFAISDAMTGGSMASASTLATQKGRVQGPAPSKIRQIRGRRESALARLEPRVGLVDHVDAALAPDDA